VEGAVHRPVEVFLEEEVNFPSIAAVWAGVSRAESKVPETR
jgi:hypothetical protein